jgi:N-hydroxyarylamine O-acetyltransferase
MQAIKNNLYIAEHQESPFNKNPLITKLTSGGNITLTDTTFTQWDNGIVTKEEIDRVRFKDLLEQHFWMHEIYNHL